MAPRIGIVVPNHLPHYNFLEEWGEQFQLKDAEFFIVQDLGKKVPLPDGFNGYLYDHEDIAKDLGLKHSWIIPKGTSACRSYGYYKAWQAGCDYIITLDNDCYPDGSNFIGGHLDNLQTEVTLGWWPSNNQFEFTRGYPYDIRNKNKVGVSHGIWSQVPDLDAATALNNIDLRFRPAKWHEVDLIPQNNFYTMCGMNLAWRAELTPIMYFGIFGPDWGFDQYDDIWAGVLSKKVMDHLGYAVLTGYPSVEHRKQSNVYVNLRKQAPGLEMNEYFWEVVRDIKLTSDNIIDSYEELILKLPENFKNEPEGWTSKFKQAALIWINLFK